MFKSNLSYTILKSIIIQLIEYNFSPSEINNFVFTTINDYIDKKDTTKVLYSTNRSGFLLSDEFYDFIKIYYPHLNTSNLSTIIRERYDIVEHFAKYHDISIFDALDLISYETSCIRICEVPKHRAFKIISRNDLEYIQVLKEFSY